ncbi:DNA damage-binding protein 1a [Stylosanthes scabra]|uniref:DNA damage-binding protein 1a n=1 Tax=Stylosanthes scabra TaxID=79078 RepID=A0ABU6UAN0_9FABA|nr:DNA damage-binding protein 1a [Stylosanthes scabra]
MDAATTPRRLLPLLEIAVLMTTPFRLFSFVRRPRTMTSLPSTTRYFVKARGTFVTILKGTSSSVRLVSSTTTELRNEWHAPSGYSINVATANATQEIKHAQLEYEISCLDINPIGENHNHSHLAAVGMWTDISVRIFSLPDLNLITKEPLGGEIIPRFVLLCAFEGREKPSFSGGGIPTSSCG